MLRVAQRQDCGIEPDAVSSMQLINLIFIMRQHSFRKTEPQVSPMPALLIRRIHLDHDTWAVINKVDWVLIIETNSNYVAIPADTLVVVVPVKHRLCLLGIVYKSRIATVLPVLRPRKISNWPFFMVVLTFIENKEVYGESTCNRNNYV